MNSLEDQYGYDASFLSEVPDYLKCIVCHLVLREPVQIMQCGHRFCKLCFERIKGYAQNMGTQLSCPIDRDVIELDKVFEDTGIARVIGNLTVKCTYSESGCLWTGDLRNIEEHEEVCEHKKVPHVIPARGKEENWNANVLKDLQSKINSIEEFKLKQEKEMAYLKYTIHEMKNEFSKKDEELHKLKEKNMEIETELVLVKESNKDLKKLHERELENIALKGQLLDIKVQSLVNQVTELKKMADGSLQRTSGNLQEKEAVDKNVELIDNVNNLKIDVSDASNKIVVLSAQIENLTEQTTTSEDDLKKMKDEFKKLKIPDDDGTKLKAKEDDDVWMEITKLGQHVSNIENILFCDSSKGSANIVLKWKLQNYEYFFNLGYDVYSPKYFTQVSGYCFQLFIRWSGEKKEKIGIYLKLLHGTNFKKKLETFKMPYTLEIMDMEGGKVQSHIPLTLIEKNRKQYFTIQSGRDAVEGGFGYCFDSKDLNIKDMLFIKCTLVPNLAGT